MDCSQCQDQLAAYTEGLLDLVTQQEVERHLQECSSCRIEAKVYERLHERLTLDGKAVPKEAPVNQVMDRIFGKQNLEQRRFTMLFRRWKIQGLGLAIVVFVIVGVVGFLPNVSKHPSEEGQWWLSPPEAWAQEILERLDEVKGVVCREQTLYVIEDETEHLSSTYDIFTVSRDSYRRDIYDSNQLRETQWYTPNVEGMIETSVRFDLKSYSVIQHEGSFGEQDPVERFRLWVHILNKADRQLGTKRIDEQECVGFDILASEYGDNPDEWWDRIWLDVETKLPVRIEYRDRPVTDQPKIKITTVQDQFDWNPELPAKAFLPGIPEDFIEAHPDEMVPTKD